MMHYPEFEHESMEAAIRAGSFFYFDKDLYETEKVSGGSICPKCKKWTSRPRKRKYPMDTWIHDCELCEITDDFQRMWHKFNMTSTDVDRDMHNRWLSDVRNCLESLNYTTEIEKGKSKSKLKELLHKIPFFEGIPENDR